MSDATPRILIIEDHPESVALLLDLLGEQRYDVQVALDGMDGFDKARRGRPDLILLDLAMPGIDGFGVCERLKADPATSPIPVVFLSASNTVDDKLRGFAIGGVDYITKPFSAEEVLARIAVHLSHRQRLRQLEAMAASRALDTAGDLAGRDQRLFDRAVAILERQMAEPPALPEIARELGVNERRLTELFRQQVGMTLFDYFTELRLETARHLLEGTTVQIQLIADRVGYSKPGDLTRAFRRRYGVSPREYRQARQGPSARPPPE
jgi:DNA-binding response OmpR family regulator